MLIKIQRLIKMCDKQNDIRSAQMLCTAKRVLD